MLGTRRYGGCLEQWRLIMANWIYNENYIQLLWSDEDKSEHYFLINYEALKEKYHKCIVVTEENQITNIFPIPKNINELKKLVHRYKKESNFIGVIPFINNPNVVELIKNYEGLCVEDGVQKIYPNQTRKWLLQKNLISSYGKK